MKTILYQPLFINPQAYFVFPQLYHIEKGDSYIEPANITGQLIINDLTQSLTSTPNLRFRNSTDAVITSVMLKNGENIIPAQNIEGATKAVFEYSLKEGETITITQIPDYPDQLCYDGGMCAVVYEFPILTDYTIIADRTWFNIRDISCFIGKRNTSGDNLGAFEFEFRANRTFSFGGNNVIIFADNNIVYQTKNSYNGTEIKPGSLDDTDVLIIGAAQRNVNNKIQDPYIGCHGNILLFNRSLTEYEISWVKNNMMCSKQQEHDIDL